MINDMRQTMTPVKMLTMVAAENMRRNLSLFMRNAWAQIDPAVLQWNWHLDCIAEHLMALSIREIRYLGIEIPPRMSKSSGCTIVYPAWHWIEWPDEQFICASYSADLSTEHSLQSRRLIESAWYQQFWGERFYLLDDENRSDMYRNSRGGYRLTTSVGGRTTGEGGSLQLLDDPVDAKGVESDVKRASTLAWHDNAWRSRVNNPNTARKLYIAQRTHDSDIMGHIRAKEGHRWTFLCYDAETEILTRTGWVRFSDLDTSVEVMGVDPKTLLATWEYPTRYVRERYSGQMINYVSDTLNLLVTPDHRMIYKDYNEWRVNKHTDWKVRRAEDMPLHFYVPQAVAWNGHIDKKIFFAGREWDTSNFAKFMGWFLAEGNSSSKTRVTQLYQNPGPKADELQSVLDACPFHASKHKNLTKSGCQVWTIKSRPLSDALSILGLQPVRYAPEEVKNLGPEYLREFIISFALGDGHFAVRNPLKVTISSASKKLIDDLQECAVKAGWATSSGYRFIPGGREFNGYILPDAHAYKLYIRASKASGRQRKWYSKVRADNVSKSHYDGMVYCVSVPSTAIVVRRNGRVAISGNCLPMEFDPKRKCITYANDGTGPNLKKKLFEDPRKVEGELLNPKRFNKETARAEKEGGMSDRAWNAQYQQQPEGAGGLILKRDWWRPWVYGEGHSLAGKEMPMPEFFEIIQVYDTAFEKKEQNDLSARTTWGLFLPNDEQLDALSGHIRGVQRRRDEEDRASTEGRVSAILLDRLYDRLEFPELRDEMIRSAKDFAPDKILVEKRASGHSLLQEGRRKGLPMVAVKVEGDLESRVHAASLMLKKGCIYYPPRSWAFECINVAAKFPMGDHDDLESSLSMAWQYMRRYHGLQLPDDEQEEEIAPFRWKRAYA